MIDRSAGIMTTALAAALPPTIVKAAPTVWHVLGVGFEAASMIAALLACVAVRIYQGSRDPSYRWMLDAPVSLLTMLFTAAFVAEHNPDPIPALLTGTGIGAIGAGLIRFSQHWVERLFGPDDDPPPPPLLPAPPATPIDNQTAIAAAMRQLHQID